jgi:hypothetical protein
MCYDLIARVVAGRVEIAEMAVSSTPDGHAEVPEIALRSEILLHASSNSAVVHQRPLRQ